MCFSLWLFGYQSVLSHLTTLRSLRKPRNYFRGHRHLSLFILFLILLLIVFLFTIVFLIISLLISFGAVIFLLVKSYSLLILSDNIRRARTFPFLIRFFINLWLYILARAALLARASILTCALRSCATTRALLTLMLMLMLLFFLMGLSAVLGTKLFFFNSSFVSPYTFFNPYYWDEVAILPTVLNVRI